MVSSAYARQLSTARASCSTAARYCGKSRAGVSRSESSTAGRAPGRRRRCASARPAARAPSRVASARAGDGAAVQARDVSQQRREGGRRCAHQIGNCLRPPARLDEALAQMEEMALDLRLAGAPQILARNRQRPRTDPVPKTRSCARRISAYSSGNASSDRRNSWSGRMSGNGQSVALPLMGELRARVEIGDAERINQGKAGERRARPRLRCAARRRRAIGDGRRRRAAGR